MTDPPSSRPAPATPIVRQQGGSLSLAFDDEAVQSRMLAADPAALVLEYTRLMMGFLLFHPAPARIAMIGLGGGSLARYCARRLPAADVTAVEVSAAVIALRDVFAVPADGPRSRVRCADGADFVRDAAEPLDVLLVDGFDRDGQPPQLCSAAFYDDCRACLGADGVLVVNLHTDDAVAPACVERLATAFEGRIASAAAASGNLVVFAGAAPPFPPPFPVLVDRLRALEAYHPVGLATTLRRIVTPTAAAPSRRRPRRAQRR